MNILIVDDSPSVIAKLAQLCAEHLPYAPAKSFTKPAAALEHCAEHPVTLIILDHEMPGLTGLEFLRKLRAMTIARQPFVLFFTRTDQRDIRLAALELGASDFLTKPMDDLELVARVRNLLDLSASHQLLAEQAASTAKSRFLSTMSHELRTPLNGILGMAELLAFAALPQEARHYVDTIKTCGQTLTEKISNILTFSNLNLRNIEMRNQVVNLRSLFQEIDGAERPEAERKRLRFETAIAPEVPLVIIADAAFLQQMIGNIINNAIKFTSEGHVIVEVKSRHDSSGQIFLVIDVIDSGVGMDMEAYRLFTPFSQEDSSHSRRYEGIGLGLAVAHEIIHLMDGEVSVVSEIGQGTKFRIVLPVIERRARSRQDAPPSNVPSAIGLKRRRSDYTPTRDDETAGTEIA